MKLWSGNKGVRDEGEEREGEAEKGRVGVECVNRERLGGGRGESEWWVGEGVGGGSSKIGGNAWSYYDRCLAPPGVCVCVCVCV